MKSKIIDTAEAVISAPLVHQVSGGCLVATAFRAATGVRSPLILGLAFLAGVGAVTEGIRNERSNRDGRGSSSS